MADDLDPSHPVTGEAVAPGDPAQAAPAADNPLPTMVDLDRVASELDDIDARLAALDERRS